MPTGNEDATADRSRPAASDMIAEVETTKRTRKMFNLVMLFDALLALPRFVLGAFR